MKGLFIVVGVVFTLGIAFIAKPAEAFDSKCDEKGRNAMCVADCIAENSAVIKQSICCGNCGFGGPVCGDGKCQKGESAKSCPADCGCNNNGICEKKRRENETNCPNDCEKTEEQQEENPKPKDPVCGDGKCERAKGENETNCPRDCEKLNPCDDPMVTLFQCLVPCPGANDGRGGFIRADAPDQMYQAVCRSCEFGDNGSRCLTEEEAGRHGEIVALLNEIKALFKAAAGGVDLTIVYIMLGVLMGLVVIAIIKKNKKPTECPKCKKVAVLDGTCLACGHKIEPPKPGAPAPPAAAPPKPEVDRSAPTVVLDDDK